ncbi:MAG: ABC transporter ATP-binding protein [Euryarchaeota archaeon]|nr:ABC transporter ATP-binding protein [Euryarchaeota archaeon]MDE1836098.1 ABC transporter ATP-binding protein [Euryarchaeota archaeon]MDE1879388.1 ABC transporter ATP-binding protein [Euryarchaeota archaeon]MDE2044076.1 ABC transporter ATP-binding protein [Thermoplasmata archaeon]
MSASELRPLLPGLEYGPSTTPVLLPGEAPGASTSGSAWVPASPSSEPPLLVVRDLKTYFYTYDGVVRALDGVTFSVRRRETVGLVGETGCGKSVTAFSITRLIAEPPGRVQSGHVFFSGANLLWKIDREASVRPIKGTVRARVRRRFSRIKESQQRLSAIRGSQITMIFQEPMAALNPVFSITKQLAEALLLHRATPTIDLLLGANPAGVNVTQATRDLLAAAREPGQPRLREVSRNIAQAVGVPSIALELFYLFRGQTGNPEARVRGIVKAFSRLRIPGLQRAYLLRERKLSELRAAERDLYYREMRMGESTAPLRRVLRVQMLLERLKGSWLSLPVLRRIARSPLDQEVFWQTVRMLEDVGIANCVQVARGYPHELSGGMIQRVMIAMALAPEPKLLIADEPTTALDVTIQAQILELMHSLKSRIGTSILLITHDLGVVAEVCDRVCVMYAGHIVEVGPVKDLFARPLHPYTQGLLASIPRMDDPTKKLESIPGSVPNLIRPPGGCRFHPRCAYAMERCKTDRPPTTGEGPDHVVACWLYHGPEVKEY